MNRTRALTWLAFLIPLVVYLFTAAPGIYWEDSAAFQTAAYELGIVHNPSFPTYVMLTHLFTLLPGGSPQWWVNIASGLFIALTCLLLFRIGLIFLRRPDEPSEPIAEIMMLFCVLGFSFAYGVWIQSVRAEVYALIALAVALVTWLLLRYASAELEIDRFAALIGLIVGLSCANHYLIFGAVVFPLLAAAAYNHTEAFFSKRAAIAFGAACGIGLLSYLYLPIRESYQPLFNWGDFSSIGGMLRSIFRIDEALPIIQQTVTTPYLARLGSTIGAVVDQTPLLILAFALMGLIQSWRLGRYAFTILILPIICSLLVTAYAADFSPYNLDLYGYLVPGLAMLFIAAGLGAVAVTRELLKLRRLQSRNLKLAVPLVMAIALLLKASYLFGVNYPLASKRSNDEAGKYAQRLLESLPMNALFLAGEDNSFSPLLCKQKVESYREDVIVLSAGALLRSDYRAKVQKRYPDLYYTANWNDREFAERFTENLAYWVSINAFSRKVAMTLSQWTAPLVPKLQPSGFAYLYSETEPFVQKAAATSVQYYKDQEPLWTNSRDLTTREHFGRLLYNLSYFYSKHSQPVIAAKYNRDAAHCDSTNVELLLGCLKMAILTKQHDDQVWLTSLIVEQDPGNRKLEEIQRAAYALEQGNAQR